MGYLEVVDPLYQVMFGLPPFRSYTVDGGAAFNGDYPSTNLYTLDQDLVGRTINTATNDILIINLGATPPDMIMYMYGGNFLNFTLSHSTTLGGSYSTIGTYEAQLDTRTNIRKGWWPLTGLNRFLKINTIDTPDGVSTWYEVAELAFVPIANMVRPSLGHTLPWDVQVFRPSRVLSYDSGGQAVAKFGRRRVRIQWTNQEQPIDDEELMNKVQRMDDDTKFLFIENLRTPTAVTRTTDSSRVELVQRIGDFSERWDGQIYATGMVLEEV